MEPLISIGVILISILTTAYAYFKYSFNFWKSRGVIYEEPIIPYGNSKGYGKTVHPGYFTKKLYDKFKPTGAKLCGAYIFTRPVAILLDLDLIKTIIIKDFANFNDRGFYYNEEDDPLSAHMFSLDGEKWRTLRAKLTPTFTSGKMKFMFPTVVKVGERFRDHLFDMIKEHDEIEIRELCARYTTDVIGTCIFGIECNSLKDPNAEFRQYGRRTFSEPKFSTLTGLILNGYRNFFRKLHVKIIPDDITAFYMNVIRQTVDYREKHNIRRNDFMDILINLKNEDSPEKGKLTFNQLAAQAFLFFVAGFETSSIALATCLYELALNPEIQSKARHIIQEAQKKHGQFTYEMLVDMPYIEQLFEEILRKYSPVVNLNRKTKNDYHVPNTDIVIPKGTLVLIPNFAIQNDPEYFPNPDKFDPDRFDREKKKQRHPMTYLPFGDGLRNCIGDRFALLQDRIGLVCLLTHFEFSISSKTTIPIEIDVSAPIIKPKHGVYLKLKAIK